FLMWDGVDPRWDKATVTWYFKHPKAPPEADGRFFTDFDFGVVALPQSAGEKTEVNKTLTTTRGTKITLVSVERTAVTGKPDTFSLRWTCEGATEPDNLYISTSMKKGDVVDDRGTDLLNGTGGFGGWLEGGAGRKTTGVCRLLTSPAVDAKTISIKVNTQESSPSLRDDKWFRSASLVFSPRTLSNLPDETPPVPLVETESANTRATLYPFRSIDFKTAGKESAGVQLWLRLKDPKKLAPALSPDESLAWRLRAITATDDAGQKVSAHDFGRTNLLWRADGLPVPNSEQMTQFSISYDGAATKTLAFNLYAELSRRKKLDFTFRNIAIPQNAGDMVTPKQVMKLPSGDALVLWKVGRFDGAHPIPALEFADLRLHETVAGLVYVFEYRPAKALPTSTDVSYAAEWLSDDQRRELYRLALNFDATVTSRTGDLWRAYADTPAGKEEYEKSRKLWYSMVSAVPQATAKTLDLKLNVTHSTPLGEPEDFWFAAVPVPKK
ncbi:MAG TPA: hypothetical protein VF719_00725, partial [Abditibacteriaceae bacterium]